MSTGVSTADDATHTGAGDEVDGHAGSLQHFQYADVGNSLGSTSSEYKADFRTLRRVGVRVLLAFCLCCCQHGCEEQHRQKSLRCHDVVLVLSEQGSQCLLYLADGSKFDVELLAVQS